MTLPTDFLTLLRAAYPRRKGGQGWADAERLVRSHVASGYKFADILSGIQAYAAYCDREAMTGTEYVKQISTFVGRGKWWAEDYSEPAKPKLPAELAKERRWESLKQRAERCGFRQPTAMDLILDPTIFETSLRHVEQNTNVRTIGRAG